MTTNTNQCNPKFNLIPTHNQGVAGSIPAGPTEYQTLTILIVGVFLFSPSLRPGFGEKEYESLSETVNLCRIYFSGLFQKVA